MRPGFDPTRRNRNIGTVRRGHGQDNRLVIPAPCGAERQWTEQLGPHRQIKRMVGSRKVLFLVEDCHGGCGHACSIDDVVHVLAHIPSDDWRGLYTFVFRQPTRKQRILRPVWGRLSYSADLGLPGRKAFRQGPAVTLEAIDPHVRLAWSTALDPQDQAELERLRADGHEIRQEGRRHIFSMSPDSVRTTLLYRTLLHEIGHWVDFLEKVERPAAAGVGDHAALSDAYFSRPKGEREVFAHRYADAMRARLVKFGIIPFDRLPDRSA